MTFLHEVVRSFAEMATFPRCSDEQFWGDRERVGLLITLYEENECLWNIRSAEYKNIFKKKTAKAEIGKNFGMTGRLLLLLL
jgi:hypothetical protein